MKLQSLLLMASLGAIAVGSGSIPIEASAASKRSIARDRSHPILAPRVLSMDVLCYPESEALYPIKEEIFAKVEGVYRGYGIDIRTAYNDINASNYDITISIVEPSTMRANNCQEHAGCAFADDRDAIVSTLTNDRNAQALTREERIGYYTNVIVHEIAHLLLLKDISVSGDAYVRPANDNVMDQRHFRSYSSGTRRLKFSPRQKEQMHASLNGRATDTGKR